MQEEKRKKTEYDGECEMIVMSIPKNTVGITLLAKVLDEDTYETYDTECRMSFEEVKECRNDYLLLDPTDDAFARYVLTEKGLKVLEEMYDEY